MDNRPTIETTINTPFLQGLITSFPKVSAKLISPSLNLTPYIELASGNASGSGERVSILGTGVCNELLRESLGL